VNVIVLVKQTPDTAELPKVTTAEISSGALSAPMVINPWDEYAAEEAILLEERFDAETMAITVANPGEIDALKHALAMGVGRALLVDKSGVSEGDMWTTAALLAGAIKAQGEVDVVLAGKQSVDDNSGSVYVGVAVKLGYHLLSNVVRIVDIADGKLTAERLVEGGQETVEVTLPVVISVAKEINDPRYPSFMGIRKAGKAEIPTLSAAELGVDASSAQTQRTKIRKPEARSSNVQIIEGATVQDKVTQLVDALLAEKII